MIVLKYGPSICSAVVRNVSNLQKQIRIRIYENKGLVPGQTQLIVVIVPYC